VQDLSGLRSQPTRLAAGSPSGFRAGDSRRSDRRAAHRADADEVGEHGPDGRRGCAGRLPWWGSAFGIVPATCDGVVITANFWAFDVDDSQLNPRLPHYLTRSDAFGQFCIEASSGATNRRYLQEDKFLDHAVWLSDGPSHTRSTVRGLGRHRRCCSCRRPSVDEHDFGCGRCAEGCTWSASRRARNPAADRALSSAWPGRTA